MIASPWCEIPQNLLGDFYDVVCCLLDGDHVRIYAGANGEYIGLSKKPTTWAINGYCIRLGEFNVCYGAGCLTRKNLERLIKAVIRAGKSQMDLF